MSQLQHQMPITAAFLERSAVVISALNEESCVADVFRGWLERGAALVRVVDNGSSDGTAIQAARAGAQVSREPRSGYGAAAWRGTRDLPVGIDWIIFSSADGSDQLDSAETAAFQAALDNGADLVVGERVSSPESRRNFQPVASVYRIVGSAGISRCRRAPSRKDCALPSCLCNTIRAKAAAPRSPAIPSAR